MRWSLAKNKIYITAIQLRANSCRFRCCLYNDTPSGRITGAAKTINLLNLAQEMEIALEVDSKGYSKQARRKYIYQMYTMAIANMIGDA
jgi:hypothetical protein